MRHPSSSAAVPAASLAPRQVASLVAAFGLGCASMVVASRGAASSGSPAALVLPAGMPAVMLATMAGVRAQARAGKLDRSMRWALGATLALFGAALGWIGHDMTRELPAWPVALFAAALVAAPALTLAARLWRSADV